MRTTSANAKSSPSLVSVIAATKKFWRQYHLTYDQTHYVAKEVRRALAIERPKTWKRVVARLSREEERQLIAHAYRVQGTRGLLIKTLFQTGARVNDQVRLARRDLNRGCLRALSLHQDRRIHVEGQIEIGLKQQALLPVQQGKDHRIARITWGEELGVFRAIDRGATVRRRAELDLQD
jgi:site-specific recombinase XerD